LLLGLIVYGLVGLFTVAGFAFSLWVLFRMFAGPGSPRLVPGEKLLAEQAANMAIGNFWRHAMGRLFLTDQRLIWRPVMSLPPPLGYREQSLLLADIRSVGVTTGIYLMPVLFAEALGRWFYFYLGWKPWDHNSTEAWVDWIRESITSLTVKTV
jgi:hypothetical protein